MELILVNVGYAKPDEAWNWTGVQSPFARIYYVVEGYAETSFSGILHPLRPGRLYLTPPFTLHDDRSDGEFALYYIHFYDEEPGRESVFDKYDFPVEALSIPSDADQLRRLLEINPGRQLQDIDPGNYDNLSSFRGNVAHSKKMPPGVITETQGILRVLMSRFMAAAGSKPARGDARVKQSLRYIHGHIDSEISVASLARSSYITTDHFIRLFRRHMGMTPLEYIHMKKIERAQLLLVTTDLSIREVALELSLDNISYFNRLFKRQTGRTPGRYRREAVGEAG